MMKPKGLFKLMLMQKKKVNGAKSRIQGVPNGVLADSVGMELLFRIKSEL